MHIKLTRCLSYRDNYGDKIERTRIPPIERRGPRGSACPTYKGNSVPRYCELSMSSSYADFSLIQVSLNKVPLHKSKHEIVIK